VSVFTATILSRGSALPPTYSLMSIDVRRELNRIPNASLVLLDGDAAQRKFELSDSEFFAPGAEIQIKLRYEGKDQDVTVFKGKVVRQRIEASVKGSLLRVDLKDAAVKLTQPRRSTVFREQSDGELIRKLLSNGGLAATVDATKPVHKEVLQYQCSDWDFIVSRADVNGLFVLVVDGKVSVRKMDLSAAATHKVDFGITDLYDFEFELDGSHQAKKVSSRGWSIQDQKLTPLAAGAEVSLKQGKLDGAKFADELGFGDCVLTHAVALDKAELQAWADARSQRSRMSMLRGRVSLPGVATIALLDVIEIDGVGKRFNGKTPVTGICHRADLEGWRTDIQFGLSARSFAQEADIQEPPAAGLLPAVGGLHIGVVDGYSDDPDKLLRVKVLLPTVGTQGEAVWARLAAPDAGKERGFAFRPETGDEVVVGFFNDDPRQPVVLGSLYSPKNVLPADIGEPTKDNFKKGIVTRGGTKILFNDADKPSLTLETKAQNKIVLDDDAESIVLSDKHGNKITMDKNGIKLESANDLQLTAKGQVQISGKSVDVK
jgi:Rhs element Vgr protein